jgi:hypothetical protein
MGRELALLGRTIDRRYRAVSLMAGGLGPMHLVIFSVVAMAGNASLVGPPSGGFLLPNLQLRRSYFVTRGCGVVRLRRADVAGSYVWQISLVGSCASGLGTAAVSFILQDGLSLIWRKSYNFQPSAG